MEASAMSQGMVTEYHHQAVKVITVDAPHHQAEVQWVGKAQRFFVDMDELDDDPQCHPDSFSYY